LASKRTALLGAGALALGGCLADDADAPPVKDLSTLRIYASLPSRGPTADEAAAVEAGARHALREAGGRARGLRVRLVRLDSTTAEGQLWDPAQVQANAERAGEDQGAIAYLGELDFGASAVSLPVTNEAGLLQVSPSDGLTSLTRRPPGRAGRGAPERYYPSERRSFLRLTPSDLHEVEVLVRRLVRLRAGRLALVSGEGVYAVELAAQLAQRARRAGMEVVAGEGLGGEPEAAAAVAARISELDPDAVVYAGVGDRRAAALLAELASLLPFTPVLAAGGLLDRRPLAFEPAPARVEVLSAVRPPNGYPRSARRLLEALRRERGASVARPEALYGYEATRLVLDAVRAAGGSRGDVVREALRARSRRSPIGRYEVGASGDVSEDKVAVYRLHEGRFRLEGVMR
jgi:branched-chain amino acid transport system substrate-binding protein